ncbi:glycosyltransferase family 4 protein [Pontibaca salina]|uniref:Glycosyltransferase family 4 protein n=1 Tax=Pontibaca salina TaxID=2795731 RepID=A0A934HT56_9RHOB|nr:glycosyltransferase family 1 protein [Pontibaca salina]MBI6630260.1 glycosyltransferase family 4 protein [Pontibaca salina]
MARYAQELLDALRALDGPKISPVAAWSALSPDRLAERRREIGLELTGLGRRGTSLLWTFLDRPFIESRLNRRIDVVHAVTLGYPVATEKPLVVTIHDLGPLTHPEYFRNTRPWVMRRSLDQAVRKADAIVCVSQATANEVRDIAGPAVDSRLQVVLEGVAERFFVPSDPAVLNQLNLPDAELPFILSAGANSPRKNLRGLLRAMAVAMQEIPHHLVLVGGTGWETSSFEQEIANPVFQGRVHRVGYVSDPQLRALYQSAALYAHPSLYEGFGLPVLEAMASGTPVVVSNRSSLPEVAGTAGRLSNASAPESFAADIVEICTNEAIRKRMIADGKAHAARFRWSDCAQAMANIYGDVSGVAFRQKRMAEQ